MEYKIGQRVKHVDAEFYIESIVGDAAIIGDEEITHIVRLDGLSPLYKPGDQVRVKSREEIGKCHTNEYLDEVAGKVFTLSIDHGNNTYWDIEELHKWCIHENELEWYSGVEDKPAKVRQLSDYGLQLQDEFEACHGDGGCSCHINPPCSYCTHPGNPICLEETPEAWENFSTGHVEVMKDTRKLVPEWFRDKERDRAALAEVLKIKEPTTNKWMCPKCRFSGSIPDVRQHCVVAHGESLPPPESKSYWEHWRVS